MNEHKRRRVVTTNRLGDTETMECCYRRYKGQWVNAYFSDGERRMAARRRST